MRMNIRLQPHAANTIRYILVQHSSFFCSLPWLLSLSPWRPPSPHPSGPLSPPSPPISTAASSPLLSPHLSQSLPLLLVDLLFPPFGDRLAVHGLLLPRTQADLDPAHATVVLVVASSLVRSVQSVFMILLLVTSPAMLLVAKASLIMTMPGVEHLIVSFTFQVVVLFPLVPAYLVLSPLPCAALSPAHLPLIIGCWIFQNCRCPFSNLPVSILLHGYLLRLDLMLRQPCAKFCTPSLKTTSLLALGMFSCPSPA